MTLPALRRKPKRPKLEKPGQPVRSRPHRAWVAQHACSRIGCGSGQVIIEAHHVNLGPVNRGIGRKPGDEWCISLCAIHHGMISNQGPNALAPLLTRDDMASLAREFAEKSPDPKVREAAKTMNVRE